MFEFRRGINVFSTRELYTKVHKTETSLAVFSHCGYTGYSYAEERSIREDYCFGVNRRGGPRMSLISIENLTRDYGAQKGVFDVSF